MAHAVFLINRVPSTFLNDASPYEIMYNQLPSLSNLKVFGCLCFASTLTAKRKKLDSRARKCIFLGYKTGVKGYVLYDLKSREIFMSRNVHFYEAIYPFLL